jgi:hypothetical protein
MDAIDNKCSSVTLIKKELREEPERKFHKPDFITACIVQHILVLSMENS